LFLVDQGHELLEAAPSRGGSARPPEVGVDHPDVAGVPAGGPGAVLEIILKLETLLIGQGLVRARLADVDDGEAIEVVGVNSLGYAHGVPP
jgi:hypothetical protein